MGNAIGSSLAMSVRRIQATISVILFLYFNLNQEAIELKNVGHIQVTTQILFWIFFTYKNLHFEPFNYAIKNICFDFCSTMSTVIETGRRRVDVVYVCQTDLDNFSDTFSLFNLESKSQTKLCWPYISYRLPHRIFLGSFLFIKTCIYY